MRKVLLDVSSEIGNGEGMKRREPRIETVGFLPVSTSLDYARSHRGNGRKKIPRAERETRRPKRRVRINLHRVVTFLVQDGARGKMIDDVGLEKLRKALGAGNWQIVKKTEREDPRSQQSPPSFDPSVCEIPTPTIEIHPSRDFLTRRCP
jgi:hypothetical protein